jgi:glycosyltransferase involved in cell wall biosynthesis
VLRAGDPETFRVEIVMNIHDPVLSVCMIVKNEGHQLAGALENFRKFADEIVVVDTGSTDDTREIALRYTDCVFDFPWCDDFSAARNHSIANASGDYVLWMDADDRVEPEMVERIVKLKTVLDGQNAFYFVLEDMQASGLSSSFFQLRCVPRRDDVRFFGRIHEQLMIEGFFPLTVDIVVRHHGYLHKGVHHGKLERNLALLEKERQDGRDDTFIHYYLSLTSESLGRHEDAIAHMQRALAAVQRQTRESQGRYSRQMNMNAMRDVHFHLARFFRRVNDNRAALRHVTMAQALAGEDARSLFNLGLLFQECGDPRKAIHCFERSREAKPIMSLFPAAPLPSLETLLAHIAFCHLRLREHDAAMVRLRQAEEVSSKPGEVWELLAFIALNAGEWSIALQAYESALYSGEISGAGYFFLGSLYQQRRLLGKAMNAFQRALDKDPAHVRAKLALAQVLLELGRADEARMHVDELLTEGVEEAEIFAAHQPGSAEKASLGEGRLPWTGLVEMAPEKPRGVDGQALA